MRSLLAALAALPLSLVSIVLVATGRGERVVAWERRLARWSRLSAPAVGGAKRARPGSRRAVLAHVAATLPATVAGFVLAVEIGVLLVTNLGYPLRPGFDGWDRAHPLSASANVGDSWGGPTLAGAWLVHATMSIAIAVALAWPVGRLIRMRVRSAVRRWGRV